MTVPRLVFVDGIVGAGKSRLAQWLWLQFGLRGLPADWFAECEEHHPVHDLGDLSGLDAAGVLARALDRWRAFVADRRAGGRVAILDATLLQSTARLFAICGLPAPRRAEVLRDMVGAAAALDPVLVYLDAGEGRSALARTAAARGEDWCRHIAASFPSLDGPPQQSCVHTPAEPCSVSRGSGAGSLGFSHEILLSIGDFYAGRRRDDLDILAALPLRSCILPSAAGDWASVQADSCHFCGLGEPLAPAPAGRVLARLAGRYRERLSGASWELVLDGDHLRFDAGDRPRLLPIAGTRYAVEGRPLEAAFSRTGGSVVDLLRFDGPPAHDPLRGTEWIHVG